MKHSSFLCCQGAQIACRDLLSRMEKVKKSLPEEERTWINVVQKCNGAGIDISARHM